MSGAIQGPGDRECRRMRKTLPSAARSGIASASRPFAGAPPRNTVPGGLPVHFGLTPSDRQHLQGLHFRLAERTAGDVQVRGAPAAAPAPRVTTGPGRVSLGRGGCGWAGGRLPPPRTSGTLLCRFGCWPGDAPAAVSSPLVISELARGRMQAAVSDYARYVISTASAINVEFTSAGGGGCAFWQQHIETL